MNLGLRNDTTDGVTDRAFKFKYVVGVKDQSFFETARAFPWGQNDPNVEADGEFCVA